MLIRRSRLGLGRTTSLAAILLAVHCAFAATPSTAGIPLQIEDEEAFSTWLKISKDPPVDSVGRIRTWSQNHWVDAKAKFMFGELAAHKFIKVNSETEWLIPIREAAEAGYAPAQGAWGFILLGGNGVPADPAAAQLWIEKGVTQGDAYSDLIKGIQYFQGNATTLKDYNEAKRFLSIAAARGYVDGTILLTAIRADSGDESAAFISMKKLAEQGFPMAESILATWYRGGIGVSQDLSEGFKWTSAVMESSRAPRPQYQFQLARLYYSGLGVAADPERGLSLLQEAYSGGYGDAGELLAYLLYTDDARKDTKRATQILRDLASRNDASAEFELGRRLLVGDQVDKNSTEALTFLESSARHGNEDAVAILQSVAPDVAESMTRSGSSIATFHTGNWGDALIIPVWHNDSLACFVVDTGANGTLLDKDAFPDLKPTGIWGDMSSHGGNRRCEFFEPPHLRVGPCDLYQGVQVATADMSEYHFPARLPVIGLLGMPSIKSMVMQVDYDHRVFRFLRPDGLRHPEWGDAIQAVSNTEATAIITLEGKATPMVFDTGGGADGFFDEKTFAYVTTASTEPVGQMSIGSSQGRLDVRSVFVRSLSLRSNRYERLKFFESKVNNSGFGIAFIERHLCTFDFPNGRIYLKPGCCFDRPLR